MSAMKQIFSDIAECHENGINVRDFAELVEALEGTASGSYIKLTYNCNSWAKEAEHFITLMGLGDQALDASFQKIEEILRSTKELEFIARFFQTTNPAAMKAFLKIREEMRLNADFVAEIRKLYRG